MKVAIAMTGGSVAQHFGHCEVFRVYTLVENQIIDTKDLPNPGHKPGFLPVFLSENDVNMIVAGGMGGRAQELFAEQNIEVIVGASGNPDGAIQGVIDGSLVSTNSVCSDHSEGNCH